MPQLEIRALGQPALTLDGLPVDTSRHKAIARVLMSLLDKSLLARLANDRLVVHELLRQYAAERLAEDAEPYEVVHDRHSALYCRRLQAWAETVKHPSRSTTTFDIDADVAGRAGVADGVWRIRECW